MLFNVLPILVFVTLIANAAAARLNSTAPIQCSLYANANTVDAQCNELYTCSGKCSGPFITAKNCRLVTNKTDFLGYPNRDIGQVKCTVTYGRNSARAKSCRTETQLYSCEGGAVPGTYATCSNCTTSRKV
ncbi:hypothetical protein CROQUDRAFT_672572 [Cronartium quercuum f. sp. fusiforme G11]|uniref:Secreted protein n=1 Tax=Cronartium quercuum f. sp. fusiforme G11 TaxID=708437 RepID=A0A9P6NCC7_9BASI|nr:hypothetical protein CROQUDRAFT_672572 [Cronartium quercuum f. sp. fusiforme G11]